MIHTSYVEEGEGQTRPGQALVPRDCFKYMLLKYTIHSFCCCAPIITNSNKNQNNYKIWIRRKYHYYTPFVTRINDRNQIIQIKQYYVTQIRQLCRLNSIIGSSAIMGKMLESNFSRGSFPDEDSRRVSSRVVSRKTYIYSLSLIHI